MNGRLLSVVPSADVNWLLSTEVQSGAALVAIVGGLLVARLTGLSGDRTYLRRAARDADAELALVREYRADAEADLSHLVANAFLVYADDELLERSGDVDHADLAALIDESAWQVDD